MGDKRLIEVEKTERGIAWTDIEGKRHEYEHPIRNLYFEVQGLGSVLYLNRFSENDAQDKPLKAGLRGKALIEDRSLSVIGMPETSSRAIVVSFSALDETDSARIPEGSKHVCLSYTEHDWEIGNEAEWWAQIRLPAVQFQPLVQAYESGKLIKLSVGLKMEDMYLDRSYYVPADRLDWFIEPDKYSAKMVWGEVEVLSIELTPIDLRPPAPQADSDLLSDELEYKPQPQDAIAPALNNLSNKVEGVTKALHWIFWVLVILLFVIGSGNH